jgi:hypothetical protein
MGGVDVIGILALIRHGEIGFFLAEEGLDPTQQCLLIALSHTINSPTVMVS